jgi:hypothetical protein
LEAHKAVSELKGVPHYEELPLSLVVQWLGDLEFRNIRQKTLVTREKLEWKEGFKEYYDNVQKEIAEINDSKIKETFQQVIEKLKAEFEATGADQLERNLPDLSLSLIINFCIQKHQQSFIFSP